MPLLTSFLFWSTSLMLPILIIRDVLDTFSPCINMRLLSNAYSWRIMKDTWVKHAFFPFCMNILSVCTPLSFKSDGSCFQYGRLTARSREVLKPRDAGLDFSNSSAIWQASRQQRCRDASQIAERNDHYNIQSHDFETSRDLTVRRLSA